MISTVFIQLARGRSQRPFTASLRTKILDFRGFDSRVISILRGGIVMSIGIFPDVLNRRILVGIILVGGSGVIRWPHWGNPHQDPPDIYVYICIYIYIYIHVNIFLCMCNIYIYIYIYIYYCYHHLYYYHFLSYVALVTATRARASASDRAERVQMRNLPGWLRLGWLKIL